MLKKRTLEENIIELMNQIFNEILRIRSAQRVVDDKISYIESDINRIKTDIRYIATHIEEIYERIGEIDSEYANSLRKQLREKGLESFRTLI